MTARGDRQLTAADGSEWQYDAADWSVGLNDTLYHDGPGADWRCQTIESRFGRDGDPAYAKCSCGAVLEINRPEE